MPNQPLNPDALEAARFALTRSERAFGRDGKPADPLHVATAIVSAYLAVAQPEVSAVEELDALPCASVVLHGVTAYQKYGAREPFDWSADGRWYDSTQVELPARVLYRPEVKP